MIADAETFDRSPMETIVSPRTPTSPRYHGAPVPSTMRALVILRSREGFGAVAQETEKQKAKSRKQKWLRVDVRVPPGFLPFAFCFLLFIPSLGLSRRRSAARE